MKVAYFAESSADEAALKILTEAILQRPTESVVHSGLRHRGWPAVRSALGPVLKQLHYHTDAEGFAFIVDSNGSPPHLASHDSPDASNPLCRLCQLRSITKTSLSQVRLRQNQPALKTALGIAVPAIEAWLLCGADTQVSEAAWINGLAQNLEPYSKLSLKEKLYGTQRPSLTIETDAMKTAAARLAQNLGTLEDLFPHGCGALRADLKKW